MEFNVRPAEGLGVTLLVFFLAVMANPTLAQSGSFPALVRTQIEDLRKDVLPELRGEMGTFGKSDLAEYESALNGYVKTLPDSPSGTVEGIEESFDRLVDALEAYHDVEGRIRDSQLSTVESFEDLIDKGREGPEELSDQRLLDEWLGRTGKVILDDRRLSVNREVLTLGIVYTGYALRSDRRYRVELLIRYLDSLFPEVAAEFLRDRRKPDLTQVLYRRSLNLTYGHVRNLEDGSSVRRNFTNLLRNQGRVLREVARGGQGSSLLTQTLEEIDRIGRDLVGVVDSNSPYPFLD